MKENINLLNLIYNTNNKAKLLILSIYLINDHCTTITLSWSHRYLTSSPNVNSKLVTLSIEAENLYLVSLAHCFARFSYSYSFGFIKHVDNN